MRNVKITSSPQEGIVRVDKDSYDRIIKESNQYKNLAIAGGVLSLVLGGFLIFK